MTRSNEVVTVPKKRRVPLRRCVGCNDRKDKRELIRIVRSSEGEIHVDETGKQQGRGAYICPDENCLKQARKKKGLEHSLKCKISDEIYGLLQEEL